MNLECQKKNVVVTGANRGIGNAVVKKLAASGYNIWACARVPDLEFERKMQELSDQNDVWIKPVYFELSTEAEIKAGFQNIWNDRCSIDALINNAGIGHSELFQMTPMEKIHEIFDINVFSMMYLTQLVLKKMMRQKYGSIVNMASIAGLDAYIAHCAYSASKAAVIGFTRALAAEMGLCGIRVNAVAPGATNTDMISIFEEKAQGNLLKNAAMKRLACPEEIASVVAFLISDESSFVNGQVLRVDGGSC